MSAAPKKLAAELQRLLEETRRRLAGVRLEIPELDAVAAPRPGAAPQRGPSPVAPGLDGAAKK